MSNAPPPQLPAGGVLLSVSEFGYIRHSTRVDSRSTYLSSCDWPTSLSIVSSRFTRVEEDMCVRGLLPTLTPNDVPLSERATCVHPFTHRCTRGLFPPFGCCEWCCYEQWCANISSRSSSFGCMPGSRSAASYGSSMFNG